MIDSNILIDIFGKDPEWWQWSLSQMEEAKLNGPLLINEVIYAEASIRYSTIERFDAALLKAGVTGAKEKAIQGARTTDKKVRQYPYQSLGVVFGLGLLAGVVASSLLSGRPEED